MGNIIGIDVGTTGCKVILFDIEGRSLYKSYREYNLTFLKNDYIELDSNLVVKLIKDCIKEVTSKFNKSIKAICFSVFGGSLTPISKLNQLISNTTIAFDPRGEEEVKWLKSKISTEEYYKITGLGIVYSNPLIKILWFLNNKKSDFTKIGKFVSFEELIYLNFGIKPKISNSLASNLGSFDINKKIWSEKILDLIGIDMDYFFEPVKSGEIIGEIPTKIRRELNLRGDTKIVSGGFDQSCAALGAGVIDEGIVANGMGTVESFISILNNLSTKNDFMDSSFVQSCHVVDGKVILLSFVFSAGSILKWYRDVLGYEDLIKSKEKKINFYEYIINNMSDSPSDLLLLPHFVGSGTPAMDLNSKGAIVGLNLGISKGDIVRAIIEGIIYEVKLNMDIMEKNGVNIREIRAIGGGSKSDRWLQLKADILEKPVYSLNVEESGCISGLILAGTALGIFKNTNDAIDSLVRKKKEFEPDLKNTYTKIYRQKYLKYKKLYPLLKEL